VLIVKRSIELFIPNNDAVSAVNPVFKPSIEKPNFNGGLRFLLTPLTGSSSSEAEYEPLHTYSKAGYFSRYCSSKSTTSSAM
jgi:hypothetical protein